MTSTADSAMLLDNQICFLAYRLHRGINDQYRGVLHELGLTYPQYLVMLVLWESDPMSVGRIGARLHLDTGTLSPLLKRLESAGLVDRSRDDSDERTVLVSLTASGRALRIDARKAAGCLDGLLADSQEEAHALHTQLAALVARVDAANQE